MPKLYIISGPNGAGKTTFAKEFLPKYAHCPNFINADLIALGLAPFSPVKVQIKAGKLLLEQIESFIKSKSDFALESTLSGRAYVRLLNKAKANGYSIMIFYLSIPAKQFAQERIKQRVKEGGHNVPAADVNRRFKRSWDNFTSLYQPLADSWILFDNADLKPVEVAKYKNKRLAILDKSLYAEITERKYGES